MLKKFRGTGKIIIEAKEKERKVKLKDKQSEERKN